MELMFVKEVIQLERSQIRQFLLLLLVSFTVNFCLYLIDCVIILSVY